MPKFTSAEELGHSIARLLRETGESRYGKTELLIEQLEQIAVENADYFKQALNQCRADRCLNGDKHTFLTVACAYNDVVVIQWLLAKGAQFCSDPNVVENELSVAAGRNRLEVVKYLVEVLNRDINAGGSKGSPLYHALCRPRKENAQYLLEKGAKVSIEELNVALFCFDEYQELCRYFDKPNVDYKKADLARATFLNAKAYNTLFDFFLAHGADVNLVDDSGRTPLFAAVENENITATRKLLAKGADANIKIDGLTPFEYAAAKGHLEMVEVFLQHHAASYNAVVRFVRKRLIHLNVIEEDKAVQKVLIQAINQRQLAIIKLLLDEADFSLKTLIWIIKSIELDKQQGDGLIKAEQICDCVLGKIPEKYYWQIHDTVLQQGKVKLAAWISSKINYEEPAKVSYLNVIKKLALACIMVFGLALGVLGIAAITPVPQVMVWIASLSALLSISAPIIIGTTLAIGVSIALMSTVLFWRVSLASGPKSSAAFNQTNLARAVQMLGGANAIVKVKEDPEDTHSELLTIRVAKGVFTQHKTLVPATSANSARDSNIAKSKLAPAG